MNGIPIIVFISVLVLTGCSIQKTENNHASADGHVNNVRKIGQILAEYTQKHGSTPYSENWTEDDPNDGGVPVTIICNLSKHKISDDLAYPPFSCSIIRHKELESYLSRGIGRTIKLPLDDRGLEKDGRPMPLFYTIQIREDDFFVATYFTTPHKDARKLGEKWYKFEVGSVAVPSKKIERAMAPTR